jgi:hypothetical protein
MSQQFLDVGLPYDPHEKQQPFHLDRCEWRWRAIIAGTGSGKTHAGMAELVSYVFNYPGAQGIVWEPTFPMIRTILIPKFEEFLGLVPGADLATSPLIKEFNKTEMMILWKFGSRTWLRTMLNPSQEEGTSLDYGWLDEPRLIRDFDTAMQVVTRRMRGSGQAPEGTPISIWMTTTPDTLGSPFYRFTEDPEERNTGLKVYRMTIYDNRANLPPGYIEDVESRHKNPGLAQMFLLGIPALVGEGSIPFDYTVHVVQEKIIDDTEYLVNMGGEVICQTDALVHSVYGLDYGWDSPSSIVSCKLDGDNRLFVMEEFYKKQVSEFDLIEQGKYQIGKWGRGYVWTDPSQKQTTQTLAVGGLPARVSPAKRDDSILYVAGLFYDRGDGSRRIYIHKRCVNLISEILTYRTDEKTPDHAFDATRYAAWASRSVGPIRGRRGRVKW